MFSFHKFDSVAEDPTIPQGVVMPPMLPDGFGDEWYSEGDLVYKLVDKFGEEKTIDIINAHRDTYITDDDISLMIKAGISSVRMPVGWWAFCTESQSKSSVIITDPGHENKKFVTITSDYLTSQIQRFVDAGIDVLIDIHAYPGGSANGSYNGVYPETPQFFLNDDLMQQGLDIVSELASFYLNLDATLRDHVVGVTLMNEPAHILSSDEGLTMQTWLGDAIGLWKEIVLTAVDVPPKMYVNLIETAISPEDMVTFMKNHFTQTELECWAILDVHHYFAWDSNHNGCTDGCSYSCSDSATDEGIANINSIISDGAKSSHSYWLDNGIPLVSCSEYSLATFPASNDACRGDSVLDGMYQNQVKGFSAQGLEAAFFWTWRMPYGGSHEWGWSLKHYLGYGS